MQIIYQDSHSKGLSLDVLEGHRSLDNGLEGEGGPQSSRSEKMRERKEGKILPRAPRTEGL